MKGKKILIVEDDRLIALDYEMSLERLGFVITSIVDTGEDAIEHAENERPDLVLMDLRLPGMDGLECFKELKKINPTVKVIVVSIIAREDTMKEAKELGAKGYVIKPITEQKLITEIKKVMGG